MQLLLDILATIAATIAVALVPGASILAATRLDRVIAPALVPAAALALGLVPLIALTGGTLALHLPIEWILAGLALVTLACWARLASRVRARARDEHRRGDARPRRLAAWAEPVSDLIYGDWLRGIPVLARLAALAALAIAIASGYYAWNDSLYHMGQAQKLLALAHPSLDNTLQFTDGSAHPGYFIPVWQEAIALTAWIARVDPVTAAWIIPAVTSAVAVLTMGGLAWTLTRTRGAADVGAIAWLVIGIGSLPFTDAITNGMHPGAVAIHVLMPLVLSLVLVAGWAEPHAGRDAGALSPRQTLRGATLLAGIATFGLGILHVSYLWVLGMGVLGYALVWLLRGPWPRATVLRHLSVGGTVLIVAATCLALLLPGLGRLEQFGRDAKSELAANELGLYEGENGANLDQVVRGDTAGDSYHLRADYLVLAGGLALLGLLAIPLALLTPRWPGGWYLLGAATLVLLIALTDRLFPAFVNTVSLDQARRIERVLPLAIGLTAFALLVGTLATRLARPFGAIAGLAGTAIVALLAWQVPPLAGYGGSQIVSRGVLLTVLVVLAIGLAVWIVTLLARVAKRPLSTPRPLRHVVQEWMWPTEQLAGRATLVASFVLLVGAIPVYGNIGTVLVVLAIGLAVWIVTLLARVAKRPLSTPRPLRQVVQEWTWPTEQLAGRATLVASVVLLVGAIPVYGNIGTVIDGSRLNKLPADMRTAEMRLFAPQVASALRELPTGAVVLGDPRSRNPYMAMAVAPVYVVSSVPRHTAFTPENRVPERFATAVSFFDKDSGLTDRERLQLLLDERVDAIVMHPKASTAVHKLLQSTPGIRVAGKGTNQWIYLVDRAKLRASLASRATGRDVAQHVIACDDESDTHNRLTCSS